MGLTSRQIVIEVFDTFVETEPEGSTVLLQKVRDVLLYRIEKETIEIEPANLGVASTGRVFEPDELISFGEEEQEIDLGPDPVWEAPEVETPAPAGESAFGGLFDILYKKEGGL